MQRLEVSGAVRPLYGSLGVKGLKSSREINSGQTVGTHNNNLHRKCLGRMAEWRHSAKVSSRPYYVDVRGQLRAAFPSRNGATLTTG